MNFDIRIESIIPSYVDATDPTNGIQHIYQGAQVEFEINILGNPLSGSISSEKLSIPEIHEDIIKFLKENITQDA